MLNQHLRRLLRWSSPLAALAVLLSTTALAQHDYHHAQRTQALGKVHFPVSCSAEAQTLFDEGMKLQHSFWYQAAREKFQAVLARDPSCVMAYWGRGTEPADEPVQPACVGEPRPRPCRARAGPTGWRQDAA